MICTPTGDGMFALDTGYLDDDELSEDLDSDGMGGGEIIRYEEPYACKTTTKKKMMKMQCESQPSIPPHDRVITNDEDASKSMFSIRKRPTCNTIVAVESIKTRNPCSLTSELKLEASSKTKELNDIAYASTPMDTIHTHNDVAPFVNAKIITAKTIISDNEMHMICDSNTNDGICESKQEIDLIADTEDLDTDDEVLGDGFIGSFAGAYVCAESNDSDSIYGYIYEEEQQENETDVLQIQSVPDPSTQWIHHKLIEHCVLMSVYVHFMSILAIMSYSVLNGAVKTTILENEMTGTANTEGGMFALRRLATGRVYGGTSTHREEDIKQNEDDEVDGDDDIYEDLRWSDHPKSKLQLPSKPRSASLSPSKSDIDLSLYHHRQVPNKRQLYKYENTMNPRNRCSSKVEPSSKTKEIYSAGVSVHYGYENEIVRQDAIQLHPIFASLKEELTSNSICCLMMEQFNMTLKKAQIHFQSAHRKAHYPLLSLEQILSLMMWCKDTGLSHKYSAEFRQSLHMIHTLGELYYFGMYLKRAVHEHGTRIMDGKIDTFYRGLTKSLVFSEATVRINGPFSTTSSWSIAVKFACVPHGGVVVELCDKIGFNRYFPVSWLSDYPNEEECLFIDNEYPMTISNIVGFGTEISGWEYGTILNALSLIKKLITCQPIQHADLNNYSVYMEAMCEYMISPKTAVDFDQYSRHSIETFCANQTEIIIDYDWKRTCPFMFDLSFQSIRISHGRLKIETLRSLFPNMECLTVLHVPCHPLLVGDIYMILKVHSLKYVQFPALFGSIGKRLAGSEYCSSSGPGSSVFKRINYNTYSDDYDLCFYRSDCNVPPPFRISGCEDAVYNQYLKYFQSNPRLSQILYKIANSRIRKDRRTHFVDDTVELKALISNFIALEEHVNKVQPLLETFCGDDRQLMQSLHTDIMASITTKCCLEVNNNSSIVESQIEKEMEPKPSQVEAFLSMNKLEQINRNLRQD
eukprot:188774_1